MAYLRKQKHFDGKVGIGSTSPSRLLTLDGTSGAAYLQLTNDTSGNGSDNGLEIFQSGVNSYIANRETGSVQFRTSNTDRITIDSSGYIGMGQAPTSGYTLAVKTISSATSGTLYGSIFWTNAGETNYLQLFRRGDTEANLGYVVSNGSTVDFYESSDYRLKESTAPLTNSLDDVNKLKPISYKWKDTGIDDIGFLAHEVQEVLPLAVKNKKDATYINEEGEERPDYQTVTLLKLVPLLVSAVQELSAKVTALENA